MAVTSLLVFLVLSLFGENPLKALVVALTAGVLSSVVFIRDLVSRLSKLAGSAVFFVGTSAALIAGRAGRRTSFTVGWRASTKPSVVSNSSFRASDLAPDRGSLLSVVVLSVSFLVPLDVAAGSLWPHPLAIETHERLETAPGVKPGDIEYAVQRDGENLHLRKTGPDSWTLEPISSETTNWDPVKGRYTPSSQDTSSISVAVVGGSAAFGVGQADSDTVANNIATIMKDNGSPVRMSNLGVVAQTSYQAAEDLRLRFERGERYDVVIAYTGFNDLVLGTGFNRVPDTLLTGALEKRGGLLSSWADRSFVARVLGREPAMRKPVVWRTLSGDFYGTWQTRDGKVGSDMRSDMLYNLEVGYESLHDVTSRFNAKLVWVLQPNWFEADIPDSQKGYGNIGEIERDLIASRWSQAQALFLAKPRDAVIVDARYSLDKRECWLDFSHSRGFCSRAVADMVAPFVSLGSSGE